MIGWFFRLNRSLLNYFLNWNHGWINFYYQLVNQKGLKTLLHKFGKMIFLCQVVIIVHFILLHQNLCSVDFLPVVEFLKM